MTFAIEPRASRYAVKRSITAFDFIKLKGKQMNKKCTVSMVVIDNRLIFHQHPFRKEMHNTTIIYNNKNSINKDRRNNI